MALQGWRLCGVTVTIVIYVGGVLFLSMNNVPGSHPRRTRTERFAEFPNYRNQKLSGINQKVTIRWCKELRYMQPELPVEPADAASEFNNPNISDNDDNTKTGLTALASFPGSGNTWLRYLLQQSTGILTGSIYKDYGLLKTGFPGENICNNSVLLVKTHEWGPKAWAPFSKAILLVRDPEKAIIAEFNRQSGGHVGFASPDRYKRTKGKYWQQFVTNKLRGWELMNLNWARNFTGNVKIVFYDDLVNNIEKVLRSILDFLEFPIDEVYVTSQVDVLEEERNRKTISRRSITKRYYLKAKTTRIQVCQQMFKSTLGINEKMLRNWVDESILRKEKSDEVIPKRNTSIKGEKYEKRLNFLRKWLNDIPKLESHYRRQYTKKLYFQTDFKSYNQVYKLYCEECIKNSDDEVSAVAYPNFMLAIKEQNISLFTPRNNMCDTCVAYEAKNLTEDQYISHRSQIDDLKEEKANDIENAKSGICLLLCMDMQAVKLIPQTNASASYYKMKLQVHNFTIYNIISHESYNYIWDESEGNLVASTFTTCIIKHLKNCILRSPDINHIIIYSDGCFYQNRNVVLSNALISLCIEKKTSQ